MCKYTHCISPKYNTYNYVTVSMYMYMCTVHVCYSVHTLTDVTGGVIAEAVTGIECLK